MQKPCLRYEMCHIAVYFIISSCIFFLKFQNEINGNGEKAQRALTTPNWWQEFWFIIAIEYAATLDANRSILSSFYFGLF